MIANISRALSLPLNGTEMFFLWGPRQAGKSTLLKQTYPGVKWVDLLKADVYRRFSTNPEYLRQELAAGGEKFVVIDEIQKVPALLDEFLSHLVARERRCLFCSLRLQCAQAQAWTW